MKAHKKTTKEKDAVSEYQDTLEEIPKEDQGNFDKISKEMPDEIPGGFPTEDQGTFEELPEGQGINELPSQYQDTFDEIPAASPNEEEFPVEDNDAKMEEDIEHTPEKRLECPHCAKLVAERLFQRHLNKFHGGKERVACDQCHEQFDTFYDVMVHKREQHGVKDSYGCSRCHKVGFTNVLRVRKSQGQEHK